MPIPENIWHYASILPEIQQCGAENASTLPNLSVVLMFPSNLILAVSYWRCFWSAVISLDFSCYYPLSVPSLLCRKYYCAPKDLHCAYILLLTPHPSSVKVERDKDTQSQICLQLPIIHHYYLWACMSSPLSSASRVNGNTNATSLHFPSGPLIYSCMTTQTHTHTRRQTDTHTLTTVKDTHAYPLWLKMSNNTRWQQSPIDVLSTGRTCLVYLGIRIAGEACLLRLPDIESELVQCDVGESVCDLRVKVKRTQSTCRPVEWSILRFPASKTEKINVLEKIG